MWPVTSRSVGDGPRASPWPPVEILLLRQHKAHPPLSFWRSLATGSTASEHSRCYRPGLTGRSPPGKSEDATADQLAVGFREWTGPRVQSCGVSEVLNELVDLSSCRCCVSRCPAAVRPHRYSARPRAGYRPLPATRGRISAWVLEVSIEWIALLSGPPGSRWSTRLFWRRGFLACIWLGKGQRVRSSTSVWQGSVPAETAGVHRKAFVAVWRCTPVVRVR